MFSLYQPPKVRGQGLVEYALLLTLVSVVVIATLTLLGPNIANVFSQITVGLGASGAGGANLAITKADYDSGKQELHLHATVNGGHDPGITLTASPGGVLDPHSHHGHYHIRYGLAGCPCLVTVTSSAGGSASVTVGP